MVNKKMEPRCVNCGLRKCRGFPGQQVDGLNEWSKHILRTWIPGHVFEDQVDPPTLCQKCFHIIKIIPEGSKIPVRTLGHENLCLGCGISIMRSRYIQLAENSNEIKQIRTWNGVPQYQHNNICRACHKRVLRQIQGQIMHHKAKREIQPHLPEPAESPLAQPEPAQHAPAHLEAVQPLVS